MLILLNKPYGVLCQFTDRSTPPKPTLADYVRVPDVYPAGRLDFDSEGLVVLTDDGALAHRLTDPKHKLAKTYLVQVEGTPDDAALARLRQGVVLNDGPTLPADAEALPGAPEPLAARSADPRSQERARRVDPPHDPRGPQPAGAPHDGGGRLADAPACPRACRSV